MESFFVDFAAKQQCILFPGENTPRLFQWWKEIFNITSNGKVLSALIGSRNIH